MYQEATTGTRAMGNITVKITHITWRNGRPRFIPGTNLRQLGYRGQDLKHPDGSYYSLAECKAWSDELCQSLKKVREEQTATMPKPAARRLPSSSRGFLTIGQIYEQWLRSPRFTGGETKSGRRSRKPLKPNSIKLYKKMMGHLERDHPAIWNTPAAAIHTHHFEALYDKLDEELGVSVSCAIMATLSAMLTYAVKMNMVNSNLVRSIEVSQPAPNLRVGTITEMKHLIATADAIGLPQIGDSIMLGLMTGQRQSERLQLVETKRENGRILFRQQKTGAICDIPEIHQLTTRLDANYQRRRGSKINWPGIIIDEARQVPYTEQQYYKHFKKVVAAAALTMPSLADFLDKHLRKTCVTWLANAKCTNLEIAQITGHSSASVAAILKHYAASDPERADNAITKLDVWLAKKGADL